jgi:hypothetical protein
MHVSLIGKGRVRGRKKKEKKEKEGGGQRCNKCPK